VLIPSSPSPEIDAARRVNAEVFGPPTERRFAIRYWDGSMDPGAAGLAPAFTLILRHPGALRAMLLPPSQLAFAEAFLRDDIDFDGDLEAAAPVALAVADRLLSARRHTRIVPLLLRLPPSTRAAATQCGTSWWGRRHTRRRDADAIRHHYDMGNEFYRLWLDQQMVYSCAYFPTGVETIDAAQAAKLDYTCRKLRLRPGERLLDIGCGWGALIRHAVRGYGVEAVGITLSPAQAELASRRIVEDHLTDRCRVELRDYRDLPDQPAFDKVVSVGMFEHVGRANLPKYFAKAYQVLRPGGLFLNHGIVDLESARPAGLRNRLRALLWREGRFLERHVFPNAELLPLADVVREGERAGFETRDVESLREHYVLTLRHWLRRLEARKPEAVALVGEARYRVWRLYLAAAASSFAHGRMGVAQLLVSKPGVGATDIVPLSRRDLCLDPQPELREAWTESL
jgi:cyclopropane-fatty-acyl-phospholipid synthase